MLFSFGQLPHFGGELLSEVQFIRTNRNSDRPRAPRRVGQGGRIGRKSPSRVHEPAAASGAVRPRVACNALPNTI